MRPVARSHCDKLAALSKALPKGFVRTIELASVAAALGYLALYLFFALQRIAYPFELEWMEGGSLEHLMRVLRHQPLFVAPSLDFVPYPYPPFYYYLAAVLSPLFGANLFTLRLISLLSSLLTAALIFRWVQRDAGNGFIAVACAGLFLATWRMSGLFFDVARVDSLFCFLLIASLFLLRFHPGTFGLLGAASLGFLAVMTKQTGAVVVAAVALWCTLLDWNASGRSLSRLLEWPLTRGYAIPLAVLVGVGTLLLNGVLDEHFLLHIVNAQQRHGILGWKVGLFLFDDLLTPLPIACLVVAGWLLFARRTAATPGEPTAGIVFHLVVLAGILLAGMIPRIKVSGAANSLIPIYAWLAILFGVGLGRLRERARTSPTFRTHFGAFAALCCLAQLVLLFRLPQGYLPTAADRAGGERFLGELRAVAGEILIPGQGYLAGLAGKRVYAHQMPVSDYAKSGLPEASALQEEYRRAIRERRFAWIVDSNTGFIQGYAGHRLLEENYRMTGWAFEDPTVFVPISGAQIRPGKIFVRRDDREEPVAPGDE